MNENVENIHEEIQCRQNVVGFFAFNNTAGVIEDEAGENDEEGGRNSNTERGHVKEHSAKAGQESDEQPREKEGAEEGKVGAGKEQLRDRKSVV